MHGFFDEVQKKRKAREYYLIKYEIIDEIRLTGQENYTKEANVINLNRTNIKQKY